MNILHTTLAGLAAGLALAACHNDDYTTPPANPSTGTQEGEGAYTSYWYYSYEADKQLNGTRLGLETDADFRPYTTLRQADTLFVANENAQGYTLMLVDAATERTVRTLRTWTFNGREHRFGSRIEALAVDSGRLYVSERESRIHVFALPTLQYISCIGNGQWHKQVFQAQALAVEGNYIYARDKDSRVSIYKKSDATEANYERVPRYRQAAAGGAANNSFAAHNMLRNDEGHLLLTDYETKKIRVLDPSLVNGNLANGTSIDLTDQEIATPFRPRTIALAGQRLYATSDLDQLHVYDRRTRTWTNHMPAVKGYTFGRAERVYAQDDSTLWVSDTDEKKRVLVRIRIHRNEIREYERMDNHIIKVKKNATHGRAAETFYVDTRTHEIVDR